MICVFRALILSVCMIKCLEDVVERERQTLVPGASVVVWGQDVIVAVEGRGRVRVRVRE